ncbi:hypothetical protein ASPZODRAFT_37403, partial [Penicilliopsis zonata CBS 506.65]
LFLFIQSDIKTIILPGAAFLLASLFNIHCDFKFLLHWNTLRAAGSTTAWTSIHLLIFAINNQTQAHSIIEDTINKPWRPIPSQRISITSAKNVRRVFLLTAIIYAQFSGILLLTLLFLILDTLYNTTKLHENALSRNILCSGAYSLIGCAVHIITNRTYQAHVSRVWLRLCDLESLSKDTIWSLLMIGLVVLTTIHISDLPDVDGDLLLGRQTMPIM